MKSLPWPEMQSQRQPEHPIRRLLDYLIWVTREMRQLGFHSGSERDEWCRRCQQAYRSLFVPMVPGHGDPYPPDVPPARNPGIWPDIPAAGIPGMTVRHQLTVIEMLGRQLRDRPWPHARANEVGEWDRRLDAACTALDHGEGTPLPETEQSEASQEALDQAEATEKALRDRQRRRNTQLRQHFEMTRTARKSSARKRADRKASDKEDSAARATERAEAKARAAQKVLAAKAAKEKTAERKTAKKKAAAAQPAKKQASKTPKPKKAAKAKTAKKKTAGKKVAKKKTAKRK